MAKPYDFFVSYASEDRGSAAVTLVTELQRRRFEVWFDQHIITNQEGFDEKIRAGLRECHYGVVILSPHFLRKDWPTRELDILLMTEAIDGRRRILAVLHEMTIEELETSWPRLTLLEPVPMSAGITVVCDRLEPQIYTLAAERKDLRKEGQREAPFPPIRALGILAQGARLGGREAIQPGRRVVRTGQE